MGFIMLTYICVLVSSDSDELGLGENEGLSFGREEGVLRAVLLHLHHVETGLVLVQRLEDNHLSRRHVDTRSEHKATPQSYAAATEWKVFTWPWLLLPPLLLVSLSLLNDTSCLIQ